MPNIPDHAPKKRRFLWLRLLILGLVLGYISWYSYRMIQYNKLSAYDNWSEGMAVAKENGRYGYIDDKAKLAINYQFDMAEPFKNGRAMTGLKYGDSYKYRLIDKKGDYQGEFYDEIIEVSDHLYKVRNNINNKPAKENEDHQWQLMDSNGKILTAKTYHIIDRFSDGKARVCLDKKCGFIDTTGKEIIPLSDQFNTNLTQGTNDFSNGVSSNLNPDKPKFGNNLLPIKQGDLMGYSNAQGQIVIEPKFSHAENFYNGYATIRTPEGIGVIDTKGNLIVQPNKFFTTIDPFNENRAVFKQGEFQGVLDNTGKIIVPISRKYTNIMPFKEGVAWISRDNLYGFIDLQGVEIIPPIYSQIGGQFDNGKIWAYKPDDGSIMLILDKKGNVVEQRKTINAK